MPPRLALLVGLLALTFGSPAGAAAAAGTEWTARTTPDDVSWVSVAYGGGLFVAVANAGVGPHVMTSPDGITWTSRSAPAGSWGSVAYGDGMFVAVSDAGTSTEERVITSPDGITWTGRAAAEDVPWNAVTYGNGRFVAISGAPATDRVMTSPDGITWTSRTGSTVATWRAITYAAGQFVAVGGTTPLMGDRVMTSPDGITWATSTAGVTRNNWYAVAYGAGLFVALSGNSTFGQRVMTSSDGITWTQHAAAAESKWRSLVYAEGQFVAVGLNDGLATIMTSPDGIDWTTQVAPNANEWKGIAYARGIFVAVSFGPGSGNRVMTSGTMSPAAPAPPTATAGNREARVTVGIGSASGGVPSSYTVTASPGDGTCTIIVPATSCVVTGLQNRTAYTFSAIAVNVSGSSERSPASPPVVPRGPLRVRAHVTATSIVSTFTAAGAGTATQRATRANAADLTACSSTTRIAEPGRTTISCRLTATTRVARRQRSLLVTLVTTVTLADGTVLSTTQDVRLARTPTAPRVPVHHRPSAVTG